MKTNFKSMPTIPAFLIVLIFNGFLFIFLWRESINSFGDFFLQFFAIWLLSLTLWLPLTLLELFVLNIFWVMIGDDHIF